MTDSLPAPIQMVAIAPPARVTWKDWLPVLSLLIIVAGLILGGGKYIAQIDDNTRRIDALEQDARQRGEKLNQIDIRAERIETNLDLLITGRMPTERNP